MKKELGYDLRISSLIVFKENRKKVPVCISLNGVILKNDTLMKGNKRMLKLIDNILYKHHKVEDWTPDFMKEWCSILALGKYLKIQKTTGS